MENTELFEKHEDVLMQAAGRNGWRAMPPGGKDAIDAGLVVESDPTWTYSDDHRASNGFTLTELGHDLMVEMDSVCHCAGHALTNFGPYFTNQKYCSGCQASINQYGSTELPEGTSCKFCAQVVNKVRRIQTSEQSLQH